MKKVLDRNLVRRNFGVFVLLELLDRVIFLQATGSFYCAFLGFPKNCNLSLVGFFQELLIGGWSLGKNYLKSKFVRDRI
jgi:hypothetical protein